METKIIEVNLGIGMDQIFPRPVTVIIENDDDVEESEESKNLNNQQNG